MCVGGGGGKTCHYVVQFCFRCRDSFEGGGGNQNFLKLRGGKPCIETVLRCVT